MMTKFGNAKLGKDNYYRITSRKEGNNMKKLHRLIWEDYYQTKIPKSHLIHHINGNTTDNRIQNLQCVKKEIHSSFHAKNSMLGKNHSKKTIKKISNAKKQWLKNNKHPMLGKKHTKKSKIKMSESHKEFILDAHPKFIKELDTEKIIKLYNLGYSINSISKIMQRDWKTIKRRLVIKGLIN